MTDVDIVDRIDQLIDEQLAEGETASDYLTDDHTYPRCPHCHRHWHGLRITQRIARMYDWAGWDPTYTAAHDDTPVLCEGSNFIGPQRPPAHAYIGEPIHLGDLHVHTRLWLPGDPEPTRTRREINFGIDVPPTPPWIILLINSTLDDLMSTIGATRPRWALYDGSYQLVHRSPPAPTCPPADLTVEFGPQNWIHELTRVPAILEFPRPFPRWLTPLERDVRERWDEFSAIVVPVPSSPGYDFDTVPVRGAGDSAGPAVPTPGARR